MWAAKCLISRLKARQAQASPCYPLLISPPHSCCDNRGEIPERYPVCRCQRPPALRYRFRSCPAASAQRKRSPACSSQPAGTEAEPGIHPGSTEPEEDPGSGSQGGKQAGGWAVRSPSANGTREVPDPHLPWAGTPVSLP